MKTTKKKEFRTSKPTGRTTKEGYEIWSRSDGTEWEVPPAIWTTPAEVRKRTLIAGDSIPLRILATLTKRTIEHVSGTADKIVGKMDPPEVGADGKKKRRKYLPFDRNVDAATAFKIAEILGKQRRQIRGDNPSYKQHFKPEAAPPVQQDLFSVDQPPATNASGEKTIEVTVTVGIRFVQYCEQVGTTPDAVLSEVSTAMSARASEEISHLFKYFGD